jgi:tRNA (mo5U34)-methyltransferase
VSETASKLTLRRETDRSAALRKSGWYHSFEFPDGTFIEGVQSAAQLKERWARFPLPSDLTGKRVLDVGAWDGWFSFEAERRGANVVAVDVVEIPNLLSAREKLGSQIEYRVTNLYKIPALGIGSFDYVFFLGVLYHVKHPLLALEVVCALATDIAIVESAVIDGPEYLAGVREEIPTLEFFETDELGGHFDNWFGPSVSCLMAMCRAVGFARVELLSVTGTTASVACYRHWPPPEEPFTEPAPELGAVGNSADFGINIRSDRDEYLTWWFTSDEPLTRDNLQFEVGGFGCHAVWLTRRDGSGWSANTIVPPGLRRGWVQTRMRTAKSPWSRNKRIAVDIPTQAPGALQLISVQDGASWKVGEISPEATHIVLWVCGLGENSDRANVGVFWNGSRLLVDFVGEPADDGARQINARVPPDTAGPVMLFVRYGGTQSNAVEMTSRQVTGQ